MKCETKEVVLYKLRNLIDTLSLFSSVIFLLFLVVTLVCSLQYGIYLINSSNEVYERIFFVGVIVAIVTSIGEWITGRINFFSRLVDEYKLNNRRRNKKCHS